MPGKNSWKEKNGFVFTNFCANFFKDNLNTWNTLSRELNNIQRTLKIPNNNLSITQGVVEPATLNAVEDGEVVPKATTPFVHSTFYCRLIVFMTVPV